MSLTKNCLSLQAHLSTIPTKYNKAIADLESYKCKENYIMQLNAHSDCNKKWPLCSFYLCKNNKQCLYNQSRTYKWMCPDCQLLNHPSLISHMFHWLYYVTSEDSMWRASTMNPVTQHWSQTYFCESKFVQNSGERNGI